jgi:hypothetical protein
MDLHLADPSLDDEMLIVALEERLSRESGADARNRDTFGDCAGGWSFKEALEANQLLRRQKQQQAHYWSGCQPPWEANARQRPFDQPSGTADNSLLALRERGRRLLDTMGTAPRHAPSWPTWNNQSYVDHLMAYYPNVADVFTMGATEADLRAEAPSYEQPTGAGVPLPTSPSCLGTVPHSFGGLSGVKLLPRRSSPVTAKAWPDFAAEIPSAVPSDGLRVGAPCFEPGATCSFECVSTDDGAAESEDNGDTVASEEGEVDDLTVETVSL